MSALAIRNRELGVGPRELAALVDARIQDNFINEKFTEDVYDVVKPETMFLRKGDFVGITVPLQYKFSVWNISDKKLLWTYQYSPAACLLGNQINLKGDVAFCSCERLPQSESRALHVFRRVFGKVEHTSLPIERSCKFKLTSDKLITLSQEGNVLDFQEENVLDFQEENGRDFQKRGTINIYPIGSKTPTNTFFVTNFNEAILSDDERFYVIFAHGYSKLFVLDLQTEEIKVSTPRSPIKNGYCLCQNEIFYSPSLSSLKESYLSVLGLTLPSKEGMVSLAPLKGPIFLLESSSSKIIFKNNEMVYSLDILTRKVVKLSIQDPLLYSEFSICSNILIFTNYKDRQRSTFFFDLNSGELLKKWKGSARGFSFAEGKLVFTDSDLHQQGLIVRDYLFSPREELNKGILIHPFDIPALSIEDEENA